MTARPAAEEAAPTLGRPRSEAVSRAILDATLDLVAEHGSIGAISMDAVAARSGASKATIYRRWSSKEALVAAAVDAIKSPPELHLPHESVRDDLIRLGRSFRTSLPEKERRVLRCIMFEAANNPELQAQQDTYLARRREAGRSVFRHWVDEGSLRPDLDVPLAAAMFANTILMVMVYDHYPDLKSPDLAERVVDQLLGGIEATAG
ncbi:MAG: TetR/AcrR family transcriptional regulator [Microthrixaceae bacterium]